MNHFTNSELIRASCKDMLELNSEEIGIGQLSFGRIFSDNVRPVHEKTYRQQRKHLQPR